MALDPSSTKTGYAVGIGIGARNLIEAGLFVPDSAKLAHLRAKEMAMDAVGMAKEHSVSTIVIERPSPQAPAGKKGARGQATYGEAVGIVEAHCWLLFPGLQVDSVRADVWKNRVNKKRLQQCIAHEFPKYDIANDPDGDVSDAIGLMQWWFQQQRIGDAA